MKTRFRAALATLFVVLQLSAITAFASDRFHLPWNLTPQSAPAFAQPDSASPTAWNRLVVSRWDSQHYINLALRGYSQCPPSTMGRGGVWQPPATTMLCDLAYFPGYALAGRLASLDGLIPIDYALLAVSLVSAWLFFFLWTSPEITRALGVDATLVALVCFNLFTTGFTVVTLQTEPLLLVAGLGAFVLARRGHFVAGAFVAGIATGVRVSGVATGIAFAALVAVEAWRARPLRLSAWIARAALCALAFWGLGAMLAYDKVVFHDPWIYVHAHEAAFGHQDSLLALLSPEPKWFLGALVSPLHEGVFVAAALVWLGLGHQEAMRRFTPSARAYWYTLTIGVLGVSVLGSFSRDFIGMNRYILGAIPVFFAMGKVLERRRLALALWLGLSAWHYWNVDLCYFVGGPGHDTIVRCHGFLCT